MIDGTTLRAPNSAANNRGLGRSRNGSRSSRSPLTRLCVFICAGSGAILNAAAGPYAASEWQLFLEILKTLPADILLIGDRAYCSYLSIVLIRARGSHILVRRHAWRRDYRVCKLGRKDEIHEWERPNRAWLANPELLSEAPRRLQVRVITRTVERRGYRSWELKLVTTLLDSVQFPADELVQCYLRRWDIELHLRTLKAHYGMERLSGKSPDVIYKEIFSTLVAYNCVVVTMAASGGLPCQLSHTRARALLLEYSARMSCAQTRRLPEIHREMLVLIARAKLKRQDRPPEPRAIIQRPNPYGVLTISRKAWRRRYKAA